jgi:hypothetical protein
MASGLTFCGKEIFGSPAFDAACFVIVLAALFAFVCRYDHDLHRLSPLDL